MNPARPWLILSVALNGVLAAALFRSSPVSPPAITAAAASHQPQATAATPLWQRLDTPDSAEFARRLAAFGLSAREIHPLILMRMSDRMRASDGDAQLPYWRSRGYTPLNPQARAARLGRMADEQAQLRPYFVSALADDPLALERAQRRYGPLSVAKMQAIAVIEGDYGEMSLRQSALQPRPANESQQVWNTLQAEKLADLKALLTPGEFTDYEMRDSPTADRLRIQLEAFRPTEQEYKAIFAAQRPWADQLGNPSLTPEQKQTLEKQINAQVTALLGPERAADDLEVATHQIDQTARLIARLELPAHTYVAVRQIRDDLAYRAMALLRDTSLPAAEQAARRADLATEARTRMTAVLGARGFEAYNELKGDWVRVLATGTVGQP